MGGWRAEKRKSYSSASVAGCGGRLSARQSRRFRHRAPLSGFTGGRSNAPPSSASSWQGLVVVPGGAPAPPECRSCEIDPQAPHLFPPTRASRQRPSSGRGACKISANWRAGISSLLPLAGEECKFLPACADMTIMEHQPATSVGDQFGRWPALAPEAGASVASKAALAMALASWSR
jgi:hypothetical protein